MEVSGDLHFSFDSLAKAYVSSYPDARTNHVLP